MQHRSAPADSLLKVDAGGQVQVVEIAARSGADAVRHATDIGRVSRCEGEGGRGLVVGGGRAAGQDGGAERASQPRGPELKEHLSGLSPGFKLGTCSKATNSRLKVGIARNWQVELGVYVS